MADDSNAYRVPLLSISDIVGDTAQGAKSNNNTPPNGALSGALPPHPFSVEERGFPNTSGMHDGARVRAEETRSFSKNLSIDATPEEPVPHDSKPQHSVDTEYVPHMPVTHTAPVKPGDDTPQRPAIILHHNKESGTVPASAPLTPLSESANVEEPSHHTASSAHVHRTTETHMGNKPLRAWESAFMHNAPKKQIHVVNPPDMWGAHDLTPHTATPPISRKSPEHTSGELQHLSVPNDDMREYSQPIPAVHHDTLMQPSAERDTPRVSTHIGAPSVHDTHTRMDTSAKMQPLSPITPSQTFEELPVLRTYGAGRVPVVEAPSETSDVIRVDHVSASAEMKTTSPYTSATDTKNDLPSPLVDSITPPPPNAHPLPNLPPVPKKTPPHQTETPHPTIHLKVRVDGDAQMVPVHTPTPQATLIDASQTAPEETPEPQGAIHMELQQSKPPAPIAPTEHEQEVRPLIEPVAVASDTTPMPAVKVHNVQQVSKASIQMPPATEKKPTSNLSELRKRVLAESVHAQEPSPVTQQEGVGRAQSLVQIDIETLQETARMLGDMKEEPVVPTPSTTHAQAIAAVAKNLEGVPRKTGEASSPQFDQAHDVPVTHTADTPIPPDIPKETISEQPVRMEKPRIPQRTAPMPTPEPLAPMRTFKQDVEHAMKQGGTAGKNASSSQKRGGQYTSDILVRTARGTWLTPSVYLFAGLGIAIFAGTVLALTIYFFPRGNWITARTYVKVEKTLQIDTTEKERDAIMRELVALRDTTSARSGYLTNIHVKKLIEIPLEGPAEVPLTTQGLFDQLGFRPPFALRTTLEDTFMLGLFHQNAGAFPFLLVKSTAIEQTEQSMRTWETLLPEDAFPLFPKGEAFTALPTPAVVLSPAIAQEVIEATSTQSYATTTDTSEEQDDVDVSNPDVENTIETPPSPAPPTSTSTITEMEVLPFQFKEGEFTDATIDTAPARVLHDGAGTVVLVWTIIDTYVLIASSEETVKEVRARMRARSY